MILIVTKINEEFCLKEKVNEADGKKIYDVLVDMAGNSTEGFCVIIWYENVFCATMFRNRYVIGNTITLIWE